MPSYRHRPAGPSVAGIAAGTGIATIRGEVAIEALTAWDKVLTRDHGYVPVIWSGSVAAPGQCCPPPAPIAAEGTGTGCPGRSVRLGPGHRLLLSGPLIARLTGEHEVLATAASLALPASETAGHTDVRPPFRQILLPSHELILANGLWCESAFADAAWFSVLPPDLSGTLSRRIGEPHRRTARLCLTHAETAMILAGSERQGGLAA